MRGRTHCEDIPTVKLTLDGLSIERNTLMDMFLFCWIKGKPFVVKASINIKVFKLLDTYFSLVA